MQRLFQSQAYGANVSRAEDNNVGKKDTPASAFLCVALCVFLCVDDKTGLIAIVKRWFTSPDLPQDEAIINYECMRLLKLFRNNENLKFLKIRSRNSTDNVRREFRSYAK